ncbi:MAG: DUF6398 domain-containing protein, partial [Acidimicrobiales bacterium]
WRRGALLAAMGALDPHGPWDLPDDDLDEELDDVDEADQPYVFRRRGRSDTAAAAVCWAVGRANDLFAPSGGAMMVKDLVGHFGLPQSSVSRRAATMLKAAGIDYRPAWDLFLGRPHLLVSSRRRRIIERRDRYRTDA